MKGVGGASALSTPKAPLFEPDTFGVCITNTYKVKLSLRQSEAHSSTRPIREPEAVL